MNFWINRRNTTVECFLKITKTVQQMFSVNHVREILSERPVRITYNHNRSAFLIAMDYDASFYSVVQNHLSNSCYTDHDGEFKIARRGNVREIWTLPDLMYLQVGRYINMREMSFAVKFPYMNTINSAYIN